MYETKRLKAYSDIAIIVKRGSEVIGHVPERLAECSHIVRVYSSCFTYVYKHPINISTL